MGWSSRESCRARLGADARAWSSGRRVARVARRGACAAAGQGLSTRIDVGRVATRSRVDRGAGAYRLRRAPRRARDCTFDDPADFSKATTVRVTAPRDAGGDVALVKDASVFIVVVTTVGVDAARTAQRPSTHAADRHDGLDQRNQLGDVVAIGAAQDCRDRRSVGVGCDVVLGTGSRSIGGVRASFSPAPTARIDDESTTTREKSIFSAARSFASSTACSQHK